MRIAALRPEKVSVNDLGIFFSAGCVTNKLDQAGVDILRHSNHADRRRTNRWGKAKTNTVYSYHAVGNLTNINYPTSTDLTYKYDSR